MQKKLLVLGLIFILSTGALFAQSQYITIVNNTGYAIHEVYVSPSSSDDWGDDILEGVLANGNTLEVNVSDDDLWDIGLIDEDGDGYVKYEVEAGAVVIFTQDDIEE